MLDAKTLQEAVRANVDAALSEDVGAGDISALLIPERGSSVARIIARERAVIAGHLWAEAVFQRLDPAVKIEWRVQEGDWVEPDQAIVVLEGNSRALLTGERPAMNFLQTLSATATESRLLSDGIADTQVRLLDTRKTLPGLRVAQKHAVAVGGCSNHRIGLYDAFLIKENHITACGSIAQAVTAARAVAPDKPVEVEVENLTELEQALSAGADIIMLDNFALEDMRVAVSRAAGKAKLEASGGINDQTLRPIAETGVDYISVGALTKNCRAIDLSMRFD
jgi:nicotinate-nucleotide pyrophosphorylase (carboxylating)